MDALNLPSSNKIGAVHGRFQPFHRGHLEYVQAALLQTTHLYIGVTNYSPSGVDTRSPQHRYAAGDNPFTYWERARIIHAALDGEGVSRSRYTVVPFPIDAPERISQFVPPGAVMFTTIYERWNIEKIRRLAKHGYPVCVLWRRRHKEFEGKVVRQALRRTSNSFNGMVAPSSVSVIKELWASKFSEVE